MGKTKVKKEKKEELLKQAEKQKKIFSKIDGKITKKSTKISHRQGRIYIFSSYNNTIITLTDSSGQVLAWVSTGSVGFKGKRQATSYAASKAAEALTVKIKKIGIIEVKVFLKGIGRGRNLALKSFANERFLTFLSISDITPIPHNGCRPSKVRRS